MPLIFKGAAGQRGDGLRRPDRFGELLRVVRLCAGEAATDPTGCLRRALGVARAVDAGAIARDAPTRREIPKRVREARLAAIERAIDS